MLGKVLGENGVTAKEKKKVGPSVSEESAEKQESEIQQQGEEKNMVAALEEARNKLQETEEKLLRLAAEFDNTKKRLEREREISLKYAEENILKDLLPGIDNIERAMEQGREANSIESLLEGVELTRKGLLATLEKYGVKAIESNGQPFDPNIHEALAMEETDEIEPNLVLREYLKGYFFKERLLRPAKVIVSKSPESDTDT
jgi:molecular chaperone GrpE